MESANSSNQSASLKENYKPAKKKRGSTITRIGYAEGGDVTLDSPEVSTFVGGNSQHSELDAPEVHNFVTNEQVPHTQEDTQSVPDSLDSPQINDYLAEDRYNAPSDTAKAFLEGAGQGVAGPASPMLERALGASNEDIRGREIAHPIAHTLGEMAGLTGSSMSGVGLGAGIAKLSAKALGHSILTKAGIGALQTMAIGASDELSKLVTQDPNQSMQSAAAHIGLSGLLGGAVAGSLGGVNKLWSSSYGKKASQFLGGFKDRAAELLNGKSNIYDLTENPAIVEDLNSHAANAGAKLADSALGKLHDVAHTGAGGIGAWAGEHIAGEPGALIGYQAGKKLLGPSFEKGMKAVLTPIMNSEFNPEALKSTLDYLKAVNAGQQMMNTAAQNLFSDKDMLRESSIPSEDDLKRLDKQLQAYKDNPDQLKDVAKHANIYIPEHGQAAGQVAGAAVSYLNSIRPGGQEPQSPLDTKIPPTEADKAQYNSQLMLAQQPLTIMSKVKEGNVTSQDLVTLQTVYPEFYQGMQEKLTNALIDHTTKGGIVPYKTRIGLSMFNGQPMDSTLSGINIAAAQPKQQTPNQAPPSEASAKGLKNLGKSSATSGQQREMEKTKQIR